MKMYELKAKFLELHNYCHFAKPHDYIEFVEWHNGEGFDVHISGNTDQRISLSWGQWEAVQAIVAYKG